ncbi:unnamed protein product, partial [Mesorhabditis spiculigera]
MLGTVCIIVSFLLVHQTICAPRALVADRCPKGWIHYAKAKTCYYLSRRRYTHDEAQAYCKGLSKRASLLRIEDARENRQLQEMTNEWPVWMDAKARFDIVDSAAGLFSPGYVLRWPNNRPVRYSNFGGASRDRRLRSGCVTVNSKGEWSNTPCAAKAYAVCERRAIGKPEKVGCGKNWAYNRATRACYRAVTRDNMTMLTADIRCYEMGAEIDKDAMLASVLSEEENTFVRSLAQAALTDVEFILLGAFGNANDRQNWAWLDGSDFVYSNWERGMPHGGRSLAVLVMNRRGKWINHYADKILSFYRAVAVCKYKL